MYKRKRGSNNPDSVSHSNEKQISNTQYIYDKSLLFNAEFDPMNPDHMKWFKNFARQTLHNNLLNEIIDENVLPGPNYYMNNPFGISVDIYECKFRPRTFYLLCAKYAMNDLNIPI
jgi:hypothetical protein